MFNMLKCLRPFEMFRCCFSGYNQIWSNFIKFMFNNISYAEHRKTNSELKTSNHCFQYHASPTFSSIPTLSFRDCPSFLSSSLPFFIFSIFLFCQGISESTSCLPTTLSRHTKWYPVCLLTLTFIVVTCLPISMFSYLMLLAHGVAIIATKNTPQDLLGSFSPNVTW